MTVAKGLLCTFRCHRRDSKKLDVHFLGVTDGNLKKLTSHADIPPEEELAINNLHHLGVTVNTGTQTAVPCNCNYILFTKLPWSGDSEGTFRSSSQAATCPPHTAAASHCLFNC